MGIIEAATKRFEALMRQGGEAGADATGRPKPNNGTATRKSYVPTGSVIRMGSTLRRNQPIEDAVEIAPTAPDYRPPLLELDFPRLARMGYLVPTQARSPIADEFRRIKRSVLANVARGHDGGPGCGPLMMVASALPEEGKTFFAINLAMSLAMEVDASVVLIDADVVRPSVLPRLDARADLGFVDMLRNPTVRLDDVMLKTNIPNLLILPPGRPHERSHEFLASTAMKNLVAGLTRRYPNSLMVFDSPALLPTTEGATLASLVGQVVMVVECSQTPRRALAQAWAAVEQCAVVTSVLNKCPPSARKYADYYYGPRPPK